MKKTFIIFLLIIFSSSFSLANTNKKITVKDIENIFFNKNIIIKKDNETWNDYFLRIRLETASKRKANQQAAKKYRSNQIKKNKQKIKEWKKSNKTWDEFFFNNEDTEKEYENTFQKRVKARGIAKCRSKIDMWVGYTDENKRCDVKIIRVVFSRSQQAEKRRPGDLFYALNALEGLINNTKTKEKFIKIFDYDYNNKPTPGMMCRSRGWHGDLTCTAFRKSYYKKIQKFKEDPSKEKVLGKALIRYIKNVRMLHDVREKIGTSDYALVGDMLNHTVTDVKKSNISPELKQRRVLLKKYSLLLSSIKKKLDEENYKSINKDVSRLSKTYKSLKTLTTTTNEIAIHIDKAVSVILDINKLIQISALNTAKNGEEKLLALSSIHFMQSIIDSILHTIPEKYFVVSKKLSPDLFNELELDELDKIVNSMVTRNKKIKIARLSESMDKISKHINTTDLLNTLNNLGMKNSVDKLFTHNSASKIAKQQIIETLDKDIIKSAKGMIKEIDKSGLSELTKEASNIASEVASDPSVKDTASSSVLDKKFGDVSLKQLVGASRR